MCSKYAVIMQKDNNHFEGFYESLGRTAYLGGWGRLDKTVQTKCHKDVLGSSLQRLKRHRGQQSFKWSA